MDRSDPDVKRLRAVSIWGIAVFLPLYGAIFLLAAGAGMSMNEWIDVLSSGDSSALAAYFDAFRARSSGGALAWIFVLEILSVTAFGVGFFALLSSWSRRPGEPRFRTITHRAMAWIVVFCSLLDVAGTAALLASLLSTGPVPRWVAPFAATSLLVRQPLSFISLLWILGYSAFLIARRFSSKFERVRREKKPEKTVP